jgi:hypothetical protein
MERRRRRAALTALTLVLVLGLGLALSEGGRSGGLIGGVTGGLFERLGSVIPWRAPASSMDTATAMIIHEVDVLVASLVALLDELEDIDDADLAVAEEPGQVDYDRMLRRTRDIRENRAALAGLRQEVVDAGTEVTRRTERLRSSHENLDEDTRHSVERTLNAVRLNRLTLRDTVGDTHREVAEMVLERAAHNWAGVAGRVETIRAIQGVRIEELRNILEHLRNLERLLN